MSSKRLLFKSAAREKVLSGVTLADAVRITLGPKSKSLLIQKKWGRPILFNDDITIAKEDPSVEGGVVVDRMKTGNYGFGASRCEWRGEKGRRCGARFVRMSEE